MKKTNKSKNTRKSKKDNLKIRKKQTIIIALALLILFLIFAIVFSINYNKKVVCTKVVYEQGILKQEKEITFSLKGKYIKNVNLKKQFSFENDYVSYLQITKQALENSYNDLGLNYNIESSDDKLIINITYDENKKYILDNVDVSLQSEAININVITDSYDDYESVDLSKKYTKEKINNYFSDKGYVCK